MKKLITLLLFTFVHLPIAQAATSQQTGAGSATPAQAKYQAFLASLSYFAAQDFTDGASVLEAANIEQQGTPSWNKESGFDLIKVVHYFKNTGNPGFANSIAQLALAQLVSADNGYSASSIPAEVANEKELQGDLYEQYFGSRATAESLYAAAIALSPNTTALAAASLLRLQQMDATEAQRNASAASN